MAARIYHFAQYRKKRRTKEKLDKLSRRTAREAPKALPVEKRHEFKLGNQLIYDGLPWHLKLMVYSGAAVRLPVKSGGRREYIFKCSACGHYAVSFERGYTERLTCALCGTVHSERNPRGL